jgi:flagellar operon protein
MEDDLRILTGLSTQATQSSSSATQKSDKSTDSTSFADILAQTQDLHFSNHAQQRLQSRQIDLNAESVSRLSEAVDRVEKKGSQSSLVLMDDVAYLVNVPERMVITAVDTTKGGEGVFTKIDSVVLAEPSSSENSKSLDVQA